MFGDVADNPRGYEKAHLKDVAKGRLSYGANCSAIEYDGNTRYLRITDITDGGSLTGDAKATLNKSAAQDEEAGRGPAGDPARLSALGPFMV